VVEDKKLILIDLDIMHAGIERSLLEHVKVHNASTNWNGILDNGL
jgi:hypothetical protein